MKNSKIQMGYLLAQNKPDDNSHDEIIREVAFHQMIQRGLADSEAGRVVSNDVMQHRIQTWQNQENTE